MPGPIVQAVTAATNRGHDIYWRNFIKNKILRGSFFNRSLTDLHNSFEEDIFLRNKQSLARFVMLDTARGEFL